MSRRPRSLENIRVASPCAADWDSMRGNDRVRFCEHCAKSVYHLSAMTRKDALKLARDSGGRLCVRYTTRADSRIETLTPPAARLHQIGRRVSRVAAGAAAAALSLSSGAAAATPSSSPRVQAATGASAVVAAAARGVARASNLRGSDTPLTGTVYDPNGAVIPGAIVTAINEETKTQQATVTDEEGIFRFDNVTEGFHTLKVMSPGFARYEQKNVAVSGGPVRVELSLDGVSETMGVVEMVGPSEPLAIAAAKNDFEAVKELLAGGADARVRDKATDSTALDEAVEVGNSEMVRALLGAGADAGARSKEGRTALMGIDEDGSEEIVRALLDAGADVNARDDYGESALGYASMRENAPVVRALLGAGAEVNGLNEQGQSALMHASTAGFIENVRALLAAGADVNLEDERGRTALEYAEENGHEEVEEILREHGAIE